jgi:hypothetical protein
MRQAGSLLATMLLAMVLFAGTIETGIAEPRKNQIEVKEVTCEPNVEGIDTLVFNGQGNAGHVKGDDNAGHVKYAGPNNIIPKSYVVTYRQAGTDMVIETDVFDQGTRTGQEDLLIHCTGSVLDVDISGLGRVDAFFDFEGLVAPRST